MWYSLLWLEPRKLILLNAKGCAELKILQDNSKVGIRATLSKLSDMLQQKYEVLWNHVQFKNKLNSSFKGLYRYAKQWDVKQNNIAGQSRGAAILPARISVQVCWRASALGAHIPAQNQLCKRAFLHLELSWKSSKPWNLLQSGSFVAHDEIPGLLQVNPQFYAFRWITLLLTQEFPFPDSVRLWDTLLSDRAGRFDCLLRCCCAMLVNVREELLKVIQRLAGFVQVQIRALLNSRFMNAERAVPEPWNYALSPVQQNWFWRGGQSIISITVLALLTSCKGISENSNACRETFLKIWRCSRSTRQWTSTRSCFKPQIFDIWPICGGFGQSSQILH